MPHTKLPVVTDILDLDGKRVLVRSSLDVPVENGAVVNDFRLLEGLKTINYLIEKHARVIICGHIGRDPELSLAPVYRALQKHIDLSFVADTTGEEAKDAVASMQPGEVLLLENLRQHEAEKENDAAFAQALAAHADIYVNDAFSVAHREHASIVGIPTYIPAYAGINFARECEELAKALEPQHPALFMLGGAKFDTKMPLVEKFLAFYDHIFIGGALANDFFKGQGHNVGTSLVSDIDLSGSPLLAHPKVLLPVDVVVDGPEGKRTTTVDDVHDGESILDAGPKTVDMLTQHIEDAKLILWNGPFGNYEEGFAESSESTAERVGRASGYSVIGGGDTVAVIETLGIDDQFSFLSTAGGAMLMFLEKGTLPGIESIENSPR